MRKIDGMDIEHRVTESSPKGGMCMTCKKLNEDCSGLDFDAMPIISIDFDSIIVRCTEHEKRK